MSYLAIPKKTALDLSVIKQNLQTYPADVFEPFVNTLLKALPSTPSYIVGYGSCLSSKTKSTTSVPDFYVIVDDPKIFFKTRRDKILSKVLPPSIYHFNQNDLLLKYCVISKAQLEKHVQVSAPDVYHIGRFSKRIALVHATNSDTALEHLAHIHATAIQTALALSHQLNPTTTNRDQHIENALALSYVGDIRVEADDKIKKIFLAEGDYYQQTYGQLIDKNFISNQTIPIKANIKFWIKKSRMRSTFRWIKNILTARSWIDYMIFKIERTKGIKIEVTDAQKKWWFIHIWPVLWHLKKNKMLK